MYIQSKAALRAQGGGRRPTADNVLRRAHSTTGLLEGQPVYNSRGRVIGRIEGGWLVKRGLDPKRHQLRKPPAWATDAEHLRLPIRGVRLVCVDGSVWEAPLSAFERYGLPVNRGFGKQVALPLKWWTVRREGEPHQLELFGNGS